MPTLESIRAHRTEILALAERCAVDNIRIFGSVARGDATDDSDVDFLIRIDANRSLIDLSQFRIDVEKLLHHPCDVISERGIYPPLRARILSEAVPL